MSSITSTECPAKDKQASNMNIQYMNKRSWESLSSSFSHLEISQETSQDSSYSSDEVSVASTTPTVATSANTSIIASLAPSAETTFRPILKSILKRPFSEVEEDEESESGYASEDSEHEDVASLIGKDDDDDMCDISDWDDDSDSEYESCDETYDYDYEDDSLDGSFISFESNVRFDPNVTYIEAPEPEEDKRDDSCEMTCHEMMALARESGGLNFSNDTYAGIEYSDVEDDDRASFYEIVRQLPEEHGSDTLDLDKRILAAYMNGVKASNPEYQSSLQALVDDIKSGRKHSPYLESQSPYGVFLDRALNHVIGTFPNILVGGELDELNKLSEEDGRAFQLQTALEKRQQLLDNIEHILVERLTSDNITVGANELCFFAGGIISALECWRKSSAK